LVVAETQGFVPKNSCFVMPRQKKSKRRCQSMIAKYRHGITLLKRLQSRLDDFDTFGINNPKGRARKVKENKVIILVYIDMVNTNNMTIHQLTWTLIEKKVSTCIGIRSEHVTALRQQIFEDGDVLTFKKMKNEVEVKVENKNDKKLNILESERRMLSRDDILALITEVKARHSKGKTTTNHDM
jgi:hypothetical protein